MLLGLISIGILYFLTAVELLKSLETILSKHPLFIYSVITLFLLVLALRMTGKAKIILIWIFAFFLAIYYLSVKV